MNVPTDKRLLEKITAGNRSASIIPCPPDRPPAVGDTVRFQQATFDCFDVPTVVPQGHALPATLTSVYDTRCIYRDSPLWSLRWSVANDTPSWRAEAASALTDEV